MKRILFGLILLAALAAGAMRVLEIRPKIPGLVSAQSKLPAPVAKYEEAKDHIRRAKLLLGDVVRDHPGTPDAYHARLQAAALENIFTTDVPVAPVVLQDPVSWRILRVATTEAYTKVTVEVENPSQDQAHCFSIFDHHPLVLLADKRVYAMKKNAIERPANVGECWGNDKWALQPTQAITIDVYFDALETGTVDGMLKYANDHFREQPAVFSLLNVHQGTTK
jgi:hypothetical protein